MLSNFAKTAIAVATFAALPGIAQAGTNAATANVTMQVASQCTVSGADVYLGAFRTTDTWSAVGTKHGYMTNGFTYVQGTAGQESLKFGSVTCDAGLPWRLQIKGTSSNASNTGAISIMLNGKISIMYPAIKRVGGVVISDSNTYWPGTGMQVWSNILNQTGTGAPQDLLGNVSVAFYATGTTANPTSTMGWSGSASDTLTYTVSF